VAEGRAVRTLHVLTVEDLPALLKTLSPARLQVLQSLKARGALTVYELAKRLGRNYKNVHTEVAQLAALGLVERTGDNLVQVPWDLLRAELAL
jgi:predicted transcriptional regulator